MPFQCTQSNETVSQCQLKNRFEVGESCTSDSRAYLILRWHIGHKGEHRSQTRAQVVPHKSGVMRQLLNFVFIYQDAHLDYCHITFRVKDVNLSARGFRNEPAQMTRYRARPTPPFYVRDFCARRISYLRPSIMSSRPRCTRQTAVRFALPNINESNIEADGLLRYGENFLAMLLRTLLLFNCVSR